MATMLYRKQRAEIDFVGSMTTILIWVTRSVKIGPGRLRTVNCRLFWTRTIPNRKKCLPSNWVSQAAISMRLHAMRKVQKIGKWVPHELNDRQMERRQNTCQILLVRQKRKSFLHRIVTGDEKWIYFQNPKRKKSCVDPVQPSTSSSRPNRFGRKTLCVWWDQEGVIYYELLKPGETVNAHRYHRNNWSNCTVLCVKKDRIIGKDMTSWFSSTTTHMSTIAYVNNGPQLGDTQLGSATPSRLLTWHLLIITFLLMGHALAERHFDSYEEYPKIAWWVICLERWEIFLAWYTQIARKIGKMYS